MENEFIVKESKAFNYIAGIVMIAISGAIFIMNDLDLYVLIFGLGLFLIPGIFFLVRGRSNAIVMRMNKNGFYYNGKLINDWQHFYEATVKDLSKSGRFRDNFVLEFKHYSADYAKLYIDKFPLTNSQDKAEEEIIAAIKFFVSNYKGPSKAL